MGDTNIRVIPQSFTTSCGPSRARLRKLMSAVARYGRGLDTVTHPWKCCLIVSLRILGYNYLISKSKSADKCNVQVEYWGWVWRLFGHSSMKQIIYILGTNTVLLQIDIAHEAGGVPDNNYYVLCSCPRFCGGFRHRLTLAKKLGEQQTESPMNEIRQKLRLLRFSSQQARSSQSKCGIFARVERSTVQNLKCEQHFIFNYLSRPCRLTKRKMRTSH